MQTFVFKLARTGEDGDKCFLLLESGVRMHTTAFLRDKNIMPSGVSMKLRKHLKGKRVTAVTQLGVDRVVDFTFGSGEAEHHVLLELFAQVRRNCCGWLVNVMSCCNCLHGAHQMLW